MNPKQQTRIMIVIGVLLLLMLLILLLVPSSRITPGGDTHPDDTTQGVIDKNETGSVTYYRDYTGTEILEVTDYRITREEAFRELGLQDDGSIVFSQPGASGPRPIPDEPLEGDVIDYELWGLEEGHAE
ncbi:hypothetical protein KC717_05010 [Candidatus Dojkabacteria bacterium]|uniref:Uncharacterized protein n=1 Tax=Candidatus Dojkabacteria bacterium TaxID=2099670 RepID=A0A955RL57_9BACT|nr:hypothetical protein [Candidatus Dojkabacteria bacterium]